MGVSTVVAQKGDTCPGSTEFDRACSARGESEKGLKARPFKQGGPGVDRCEDVSNVLEGSVLKNG